MERVKRLLNIIVPLAEIFIFYSLFKPWIWADGEFNIVVAILCIGAPYGLGHLAFVAIPAGQTDFSFNIGLFLLTAAQAAIIGVFRLIWALIKIPYNAVKIITG